MQNTRSNEYVIKSHIFAFHIFELVSGDCCLMPTQHIFFPAISWREQVNFQWDDDEVHFVLDQRFVRFL
jgi:hypothetical protein